MTLFGLCRHNDVSVKLFLITVGSDPMTGVLIKKKKKMQLDKSPETLRLLEASRSWKKKGRGSMALPTP